MVNVSSNGLMLDPLGYCKYCFSVPCSVQEVVSNQIAAFIVLLGPNWPSMGMNVCSLANYEFQSKELMSD